MEAQIDVRARGAEARPLRLAMMSDDRLAGLVGGGSERAFAALYERYHQPLYRYCRSMLRNDADAQDALQSAFAGALVALKRGQRDAPLRPWLYRIAHNEAISLLRRRRPLDEFSEATEASTASAEDVAEERARLALLLADLRELPERQRGALVMRELGGLPHEDVALALGVSVGAAKQTVFEARRSLAEFSEGRAMACEEICRTVSDGDGRALRSRRVRAHLRDCSGCAAFAAAIPERSADLRALAPPLPGVAAVGVLARIATAGSGHGHGGAGAAIAATAGKSVAVTLAAKTAAGVALIATAAAGVAVVLHHSTHPVRTPSAPQSVSASARGSTGPGLGPGASLVGGHRASPRTTGIRSKARAGAAGSGRGVSAARRAGPSSRAPAPSRSARAKPRRSAAALPGASRSRGLGHGKTSAPGLHGHGQKKPKKLKKPHTAKQPKQPKQAAVGQGPGAKVHKPHPATGGRTKH
jgi:RNA polymerase sigma factor (sigma-70 family)